MCGNGFAQYSCVHTHKADTLLQPMLKCAGIAATSKLCAELCKDASQGAIAAAVEIAATLCATAVAMPVIMNMLNMIGGMV